MSHPLAVGDPRRLRDAEVRANGLAVAARGAEISDEMIRTDAGRALLVLAPGGLLALVAWWVLNPETAAAPPPASAPAVASTATMKVVSPPAGIYHAAFPDFGGSEDIVSASRIRDFEALAGKRIAWAYFSNNWIDGITFPAEAVKSVRDTGSVPFIRMMPRSSFAETGPDPVYNLDRITRGDFDPALAAWAQAARATGTPLMVEFGTEVNGDWFPWNGRWYGGAAGPEKFRNAYRHIVDLFRREDARNVTWVFHVDASRSPDAAWNTMAAYYPGDDYIDWLGISVYGAQEPNEDWISFADRLDPAYAELVAFQPSKPIAVLEFGVTDGVAGHDKAAWISDAFAAVTSGRYPRIKAMSYWHESFDNDDGTRSTLRIDSSDPALQAYRAGVASPSFVSEAQVSVTGP
jgi:hypothetical protein